MPSDDPFTTVRTYLLSNRTITNRAFRQLLNVPYDHAIILLAALCRLGLVQRHGVASGTYYELINSEPPPEWAMEFNLLCERKRK